MPAERTLSDQEMVEILEEIAREGSNGAARIAAIKALREMDAGERPAGAFADLDEGDELAKRRGSRSA